MSQAKAEPGRLGRYDNPYLVAEWHREPPAGTQCTPLQLLTEDRAVAHGWLYARGGERTVVCLMHPRANFSRHYLVPGLVEAGFAVLCINSRWLGNDSTLIHEVVLLDVAAALRAIRARYSRVVLVGNSGGGSLFTFYLSQALAPTGERLVDTAAGDPFDLNRFELPGGRRDGLPGRASRRGPLPAARDRSLAARRGRSGLLRSRPRPLRPGQRLRRAAQGEPLRAGVPGSATAPRSARASSGSTPRRAGAWSGAARRGRAGRRPARAEDRRLSIATDFLVVYRTDADPRCVDLSLDPSARSYGSLWGVRPDAINYGAVGFGRVVSPEAWLSTWSGLSSRAEIEKTGARMTLPCLLVAYDGDNGIFPSDQDLIARSLGTRELARVQRARRSLRIPGRDRARGAPPPRSWSG